MSRPKNTDTVSTPTGWSRLPTFVSTGVGSETAHGWTTVAVYYRLVRSQPP